jgi:hypothetical protein
VTELRQVVSGVELCVNALNYQGAQRMESNDRFLRITVIVALVLVAGLSVVFRHYA